MGLGGAKRWEGGGFLNRHMGGRASHKGGEPNYMGELTSLGTMTNNQLILCGQ